jgi:hypothetical protein
VTRNNPYFATGTVLKGHEFHFPESSTCPDAPMALGQPGQVGMAAADGLSSRTSRRPTPTSTPRCPQWRRRCAPGSGVSWRCGPEENPSPPGVRDAGTGAPLSRA